MQNSGDQTESEVRALSVRPEDQPDFENFKISDKDTGPWQLTSELR